MAHYNANQIIENIERVLDEEGAAEGAEPGSKVSRFRERRAEEMQPSTFRKLERGTFKSMRVHQAVDKVPEGSRFRLFKKIFARLLRMVSAPQATYNYQNLQALQLISNEIDALRDRVRSAENRDMVPFGMAQLEGSGSTRLSNLVTQHLEQVQRNVGGITNNMQEMSQSLSLVLDNLSAVSNRLNQLGVTQKDSPVSLSVRVVENQERISPCGVSRKQAPLPRRRARSSAARGEVRLSARERGALRSATTTSMSCSL